MSQTTRCPSCATLFKVVPDQLRISEGWVRCGQCMEVFDATLSLQQTPAPAPSQDVDADVEAQLPPAPLPGGAEGSDPDAAELSRPDRDMPPDNPVQAADADESEDKNEDAAPAAAQAQGAPEEQEPAGYELPAALPEDPDDEDSLAFGQAEPEQPVHAGPGQAADPEAEPAQTVQAAQVIQTVENVPVTPVFTAAAALENQGSPEEADAASAEAPVPASELAPQVPDTQEAPGAAPLPAQEPVLPTAAPEPSFVRSARRKALWHRPAVRLALGACAGVLALLLLAQVVLQQRHYLASAQPQWRPALEALCVPLQCTLRPYQHIASVVVDSSSFNKLRGDTYRFALALKNQAALPVEFPAVELTLTDTSDQPLLRRVITPQEMAAPAMLDAGGQWQGSLEMEIDLDGTARISGYRVLAFYP